MKNGLPFLDPSASLGMRIRTVRQHRGVSIREVALAVHVHPSTITAMEADVNQPRIRVLCAVAHYLEVSMLALIPVTMQRPDLPTYRQHPKRQHHRSRTTNGRHGR